MNLAFPLATQWNSKKIRIPKEAHQRRAYKRGRRVGVPGAEPPGRRNF